MEGGDGMTTHINGTIEFRFDRRVCFEDPQTDLFIMCGKGYVKEMVAHEHEDGAMMTPACILSDQECTSMMDELWRAGFRPSAGALDVSGVLGAKEQHIADLRAVAFHALKIPKEG